MENENGKNYAFVKQPKKLSLLLNVGERSLYGILLDYQTMSKNEGFKMSYSYVCKNLKITDKTAQKLTNKLIGLDLIEKVSGYCNRSKNYYKIKLEKIYEFDEMTNDEIFFLRNKLNSKIDIKEIINKREFNKLVGNGKNYAFVKQPKKLSLLLNAGERSLYGILLDYQTMSKNEGFEMSFKYLCKNLNITVKTAQRIVNRLVELDLIEKVSGFSSRSTNSYKVKLEKIYEFDKMSNDEIFEYRDKLNSKKSIKEVSKKSNDVEFNHNNDLQLQPKTLTADPADPAEPVDPVNLSEEEEEHVTQDFEDYFEAKIKGVFISDKIINLKYRYNLQEQKIIRKYVQSERFSSHGIRKHVLDAIA